MSPIVTHEFCKSFPVVVSYRATALSVALAGHTTSHVPLAVLAIVTVHADPVPHVVSVIFEPSINCTDPPDAESVTVWLVASDVFAIVWLPVFVPVTDPFRVPLVIVAPLIVVAVAAPSTGVTRVGLVANTRDPEPVSSLITPFNSSEVVAANCASVHEVSASHPPAVAYSRAVPPALTRTTCNAEPSGSNH